MENLQQMTSNATELLLKMLSIPSVSFQEEKRCDFLFAYLQKRAEECNAVGRRKRKLLVGRLGNNIIVYSENQSTEKQTLMLNSHIDTVAPSPSYTFDPYAPFVKDGAIYGLGSNDDGGSVVSQIEAFFHLCGEEDLKVNLMLVLSAEEERSGSNGMARFVNEFHKLPTCAIVGEPTCMEAAIAERGLLVIDGTAHGVSGHAARNEGVNALYIALDDINILRNYKFSKHSPLMGDVKLTVTQMNCGTAHNVVPAQATFVVDIRPTEQYNNAEILEILQKEVKSTLVARNLKNLSSATPQGHFLMDTIAKCGTPTQISATTSDWMKIPWPAIKMGPGDSSRSHKGDEFIRICEIEEGIKGYINFIKNIG